MKVTLLKKVPYHSFILHFSTSIAVNMVLKFEATNITLMKKIQRINALTLVNQNRFQI